MKIDDEAKKYESALYVRGFDKLAEQLKQDLMMARSSSNRLNPPISQISKILCDAAEKEVKAFLNAKIQTHKKFRLVFDKENEDEVFEDVRRRIDKYVGWAELSDFPEFKLPNTGQLIPNITSLLRSKLERILSVVKCEIDIFTNEMKMEERMLKKSESEEFEVLKWIYDKADGKRDVDVELNKLLEENEKFSEDELIKISDYLEGEGFVELPYDIGLIVVLTHKGIKEIKNPTSSMNQSSTLLTQHFHNQVANAGDNYGAIQQQKGGSNNTQINSSSDTANLDRKIDELITAIKGSVLSDVQKITTESHLQTIQKLTRIDITAEVSQEVESRIVAVKDVLSTSADLVSLGQIILPMIGHFFHLANF